MLTNVNVYTVIRIKLLHACSRNSVELISTKTLKVDGKYTEVDTLEMGDYDVYFELVLKNNFNIMTPVQFTLDNKVGNTEHLYNHPRNQSLWIKAGEFTKALGTPGTITFGFNGTESHTVKEGMVVEGVLIIKSYD